jgi:hypothetical protein
MNTENKELLTEEQLHNDIQTVIAEHKDLIVKDDSGYVIALEALKVVKKKIKFVENWFDGTKDNPGPVKKAHEAWKALTSKRKEELDPINNIFNSIKKSASDYQVEKERLAKIEQEKEEARLQKIEDDRKLEEAEALQEQGKTEQAENIISEPTFIAPPPLKKAPKVYGVSTTDTWKFMIENPSIIPREYLIPDEKKIGQIVRAMKSSTNIEGVKVWVEKTPRIG